ncbi:MAG: 23S rRNA (uracil(1939)-C(5))-methyltransferase RlmD [Steroidobacteraceae bacterium]|nr:23S rRNA (uracil(1939)-C(5))-methyltransferase RlmD [Steroidobacteraceae bacterium]MDW8258756.1 23S rRNA (uracil(1939)-C(5))-methyltransferase RlmD [Gammaproteobacteria bacterium]
MAERRAQRSVAADGEGVVSDLNHDGAGVLRDERDGKTIFVAGALPGEQVRFRRIRTHRAFDEAELIDVLRPAPFRIAPRCEHFGVCGGCALQHADAAAQLQAKERQLRETLARIAGVEPAEWLAPIAAEPWHYRRRARLGVKFVAKKGRVLVGFRERRQPYVAELKHCVILAPQVGSLLNALAELIGGLSVRAAIPQIEVAVAEQTTALTLRVLAPLTAADRAALLAFEARHGLRFLLQPGGPASIEPLAGSWPSLSYRLPAFALEMEFGPVDFIQINAQVNERMVAQAVRLLDAGTSARVLDLYCGIGNFSLPLARCGATVVGVEGDSAMVARARANAARNGIANAQFIAADLRAPCGAATWLRGGFTHVLLDPPRTGASAVLPALGALQPERIVYVSCHPGTLARDLAVLCREWHYAVRAAGLVDMFPHTAHSEAMVLLERAGAA